MWFDWISFIVWFFYWLSVVSIYSISVGILVLSLYGLYKYTNVFKINSDLSWQSYVLPLIPFIVFISAYFTISYVRHRENPQDKIAPVLTSMIKATQTALFEPDRDGTYFIEIGSDDVVCSQQATEEDQNTKFCFGGIMFIDIWASAKRFLISLLVISVIGILWGLHMGALPYFEALLYQFTVFFNKIPALVLLPIIFILFGLDELSKIALIVIGVMPAVVLDTYLRVKEIPHEQFIKGFTLGATDFEIIYRIILPQIFPKVLNTIRLNFLSMALLLIAGESLAATEGLGYRIFILRRYIAMDTIIPYAIIISSLLFLADRKVTGRITKKYAWLDKE